MINSVYFMGMRIARLISFFSLIFLAACSQAQPASAPQAPHSQSGMVSSIVATTIPEQPVYALYNAQLALKGRDSLLFFAQANDPFSAQSDLLLRNLYASGTVKISTFRLDFGTETGAKFAYGVIVPDTFVLLGPIGEWKKSLIHPQEGELKAFLE